MPGRASASRRERKKVEMPFNAAMESLFSSLKTERIRDKRYRTRDAAKADVFDHIERFYNTIRRHSTIGDLSPAEFENKVGLA